jgi:hypothetical protein
MPQYPVVSLFFKVELVFLKEDRIEGVISPCQSMFLASDWGLPGATLVLSNIIYEVAR